MADDTQPKSRVELKFLLCVGSIILSTVLLVIGKVPPSVFENITTWSISAYVVGNVVANGAFAFGGQPNENAPRRMAMMWKGGEKPIKDESNDPVGK